LRKWSNNQKKFLIAVAFRLRGFDILGAQKKVQRIALIDNELRAAELSFDFLFSVYNTSFLLIFASILCVSHTPKGNNLIGKNGNNGKDVGNKGRNRRKGASA
jgi:hypothetical protein